FRVLVAGDANGQRADLAGVLDRADGVRRAPAGGDADDDIIGRCAAILQIIRPGLAVVFGRFDRAITRVIAACHDASNEVRRTPERSWAFRRVDHAQAATGSRADVKHPATAFQAFDDAVNGARDGGQDVLDGFGDFLVFAIDNP